MMHIKLRNPQQFDGGPTDLFIIGTDKVPTNTAGVWSRGSDFTAAATSQAIVLLDLNIGDVVKAEPVIYVKTVLVGPSVSAATCSLGVTGALTQFIGNSDVLTNAAAAGGTFVPANTVGAYATIAASKSLTANLITTGANVSVLTAGEIWIYATIMRLRDMLTDRYE